VSLRQFYEDLWELSTADVSRSVDWIREGYVRCVVKEGIATHKISGPGLLADIGCGTGSYLREFSRTSELSFLGFDVSANALRECKRRLSTKDQSQCIGLLQGDGARLPLASSKFDLLFCAHVLEHVPEDDATLAELHRVLARGGYLRVVVPNSLSQMLPVFRPLERRLGKLGHLREYTPELLEKQLVACKFRVHQSHYSDFFLVWALFRLEETMRSMTRRSALARRLNKLISRRRIVCRIIAIISGSAIYWENRFMRKRSWGMNICCIAERVE
jgi:ubiquinone/menaquinone biosynthesis C-methylase UbiE